MNNFNDNPKLMNEKEVAELLNIKVRTLQAWRCQNRGLKYIKLGGGAVRYKPEDIQAFIDSGAVEINNAV